MNDTRPHPIDLACFTEKGFNRSATVARREQAHVAAQLLRRLRHAVVRPLAARQGS